MSCLSSARFGLLLAGLISAGLSAATLSPADQNAIEQQQKALLEQTQQQRDMLRYSTPAPSLPETPPPEAAGPCFELRYIQLENVTALPLSAQRKLIRLPAEGCMTLQDSGNDNNRDELNVLTRLQGVKGITLAANGGIQANDSTLTSDGNITLTSGGNMQFQSARGTVYRESGNSWTETVSQTGVTLNAGGALTVISGGSILFQASRLLAKGTMDVAAKGGWLYAQAMEESSHYEKQTTKRKWWGQKTTVKQTKHTTTNRVTEFTAGGNLNLLSRDDSTYEASKIEAGKNATLTSTNGKVNFLAVKNTTFEQTVSTSKGFYIKQANKGYSEGKWVLPSVYAGGKLTVDTASGISADVKTKNGQALRSHYRTRRSAGYRMAKWVEHPQ